MKIRIYFSLGFNLFIAPPVYISIAKNPSLTIKISTYKS